MVQQCHAPYYGLMVLDESTGNIFRTTSSSAPTGTRQTGISEHALMPGLVVERFDKDGLAAEYLQGLREHKIDKQNYVCEMMKQAGLLCHSQRWWSAVKVTNISGTNAYAVLRAPRATGVEAMVFAVDLHQREATAMVMAYAAFARQQIYWARDLFFVFVDGGAPGMDAWLAKYHLVHHSALNADSLPEMGGFIIGGVAMKSQSAKMSPSVRLEVNHLNGQLPNLDLFNSVVRIAGSGKFAINSVVYDVRDQEQGGTDWHMLVPLRAMYTQAFVAVEGLHSVMGKYGVQAITVAVPSLNSYPLRKSTRLMEAIARALNNVLERFHQSYFLPRALIRTALALACHPAGVYGMFLLYGRPVLGYSGKPTVLTPEILVSALLRLLKEHLVYGSNVLPLLLVLVLPMWNLVLPLALVKIKTAVETVEQTEAEAQEKKLD
ncbi:hypothetical protein TELCIR_06331 [Teladorsagia circumcincta]|uniref:Uncharacterized protein n=1 Tax=Teladorsagia circumcincta TaxID=45464 RepID=A0A2G9UNN8_TELCI|nr:hypothetical protein TELCIR_06331 [Teladorsagia circumcincta]